VVEERRRCGGRLFQGEEGEVVAQCRLRISIVPRLKTVERGSGLHRWATTCLKPANLALEKREGLKQLRQVHQMMWTSCMCREFILVATNYIVIGDVNNKSFITLILLEGGHL
jgi:hypothetical protein